VAAGDSVLKSCFALNDATISTTMQHVNGKRMSANSHELSTSFSPRQMHTMLV